MSIDAPLVISTLLAIGPAPVGILAEATKMDPQELARTLRRWNSRRMHGLRSIGMVRGPHGDGPLRHMWSIDRAAYDEYQNRVRGCWKHEPLDREVPRYTGPMLTRWQPSSPYFREAA